MGLWDLLGISAFCAIGVTADHIVLLLGKQGWRGERWVVGLRTG